MDWQQMMLSSARPEGFETAIERAQLTLRLRCRYIDYGSSSSSDYGRVGRAGLDYVL
jgi:hypothetical protein